MSDHEGEVVGVNFGAVFGTSSVLVIDGVTKENTVPTRDEERGKGAAERGEGLAEKESRRRSRRTDEGVARLNTSTRERRRGMVGSSQLVVRWCGSFVRLFSLVHAISFRSVAQSGSFDSFRFGSSTFVFLYAHHSIGDHVHFAHSSLYGVNVRG